MATWAIARDAVINGIGGTLSGKGGTSVGDIGSLFNELFIFHKDPIVRIFVAALLFAVIAFVMGVATDNYSWVDKSWSILPVYYAWVIAMNAPASIHPRLLQMAMFVSFWGIRLTYNFSRKGGYAWSAEDYRWPVVKHTMHPIAFQIFNFVFIAIIQNILLASLIAPMYVVWTVSYSMTGGFAAPLGPVDALAAFLAGSFLALEAMADEQQWSFQTNKRKVMSSRRRGDVARGFLSSGLFRYSRHPNFFAEQAFWWSMCLFATGATGKWFGWWCAGPIALTALFQGSTLLTEKISAEKYPAYSDYMKTTSRLVPWFPGPELSEPATTPKRARSTSRGRTTTRKSEEKPSKTARSRSTSKPRSAERRRSTSVKRTPTKTAGDDKAPLGKTKKTEKTTTATKRRSTSATKRVTKTKTTPASSSSTRKPQRASAAVSSSSEQPIRRSSRLRKST